MVGVVNVCVVCVLLVGVVHELCLHEVGSHAQAAPRVVGEYLEMLRMNTVSPP